MWQEKEVCISEIKTLLDNGYIVEVDSPDGYVPVNLYINKGMFTEYVLTLDQDDSVVRCNESHLFETKNGWKTAKELDGKLDVFLTRSGWKFGTVRKKDAKIPIVDINVDHENHRYYTESVSSHNTGVGKSLFMCHCASSAISSGNNVLYITMEMAEERIAERIDANLLNLTISDLSRMNREDYINRFKYLKNKSMGKLIIKEYPTSSASVLHFRALLAELKMKKSFVPDIIFVDYLNICASSRMKHGANMNSYTYVKAIAEEIRGLAVEFNVPIITATQSVRNAGSDPEISDVSESSGVSHTVDMLFALVSNEDLEKMGQIMVKQLKNRYNDPSYYKRFMIGIDRSKMKLYNLEDSAQNIHDSGNTVPDLVSVASPVINRQNNKFNNLKV